MDKFFVQNGSTHFRLKDDYVVLFADFALKVVGEICPKGEDETHSLCKTNSNVGPHVGQ